MNFGVARVDKLIMVGARLKLSDVISMTEGL